MVNLFVVLYIYGVFVVLIYSYHGSQGTELAKRRAGSFVRGDDIVYKLFTEFAYRYK